MKKPHNGVLALRIPFQPLWIKRNFIQSPLIERARIMQKSSRKINAKRGSCDPQSNARRVDTISYEALHRDARSYHARDQALDRGENSKDERLLKNERYRRADRDGTLRSSVVPTVESSTSRSSFRFYYSLGELKDSGHSGVFQRTEVEGLCADATPIKRCDPIKLPTTT